MLVTWEDLAYICLPMHSPMALIYLIVDLKGCGSCVIHQTNYYLIGSIHSNFSYQNFVRVNLSNFTSPNFLAMQYSCSYCSASST